MNFNVAPYFDNFSEDKEFYKILFKPATPVQTRELNQIQSILQNQISQFGQNVFKEGSVVIPGNVSYNSNYTCVQLTQFYNGANVSPFLPNLIGQTIVGQTSGVQAVVVNYLTNQINPTLYVQYVNSGTSAASGVSTQKTFVDGEVIAPENAAMAGYTVQAIASGSTATGAAFSVARGIYFVLGTFAVVEPQTIILSPYTNTPSCSVGFTVQENIVTAQTDASLFDNAQGAPNFAAPGADRYQLVLTLSSVSSGQTAPTNFVQITSFVNGSQQTVVNQTNYNVVASAIAQSSYDAAGNYTINSFPIQFKEYRNNNRGTWVANTVYLAGDVVNGNYVALNNGTSGSTAPSNGGGLTVDGSVTWLYSTTPYFNNGVNIPNQNDSLSTALNNAGLFDIKLGHGKAYVQGYELQKVASTYITTSKPRTTNQIDNATVNTEFDNYVLITGVNTFPDFTKLPVCTLYDQMNATPGTPNGNVLGTARLLNVSLVSGTYGAATAVYRASIGDVKLNAGVNFSRQVKQIAANIGATYFTASISPVLNAIQGSASAAGSTSVVGVGTLFEIDLVVGDYVQFGSNPANTARVTAINSNTSITVSASLTFTGEVPYLTTTTVVNNTPYTNILMFPVGNPFVAQLRNESGVNTITCTVIKSFTATANASGSVNITVNNTSTDTFAPITNAENFMVVDTTTNTVVSASLSLNASNQQLTVSGLTASHNYMIFGAVNRTGTAVEKTKSLQQTTYTITSSAILQQSYVPLNEADGFMMVSIKQDTGTFASPTGNYSIDITSSYSFNGGQTNTHYGPSYLTLNTGFPVPTAPIQVNFIYFAHSATGDYFSVNSYLGAIDYSFIPPFAGISLGDVIDFRSRVDTANGVPSVVNGFPAVGYDTFLSYNYYLGRNDIVTLDSNGNFTDVAGVPSNIPQFPNVSPNVMSIYKISLLPYLKNIGSNTIGFSEVDNKVYTMADIAKLDQRITNLEYYTSLSLLEQNTLNLPLTDSNGLNLYKNGIATDSFNGANTLADVTNPDYMCSMDTTSSILRPFYTANSVQMVEQNSTNAQRQTSGYQRTGNLITLPYINTPYISQSAGTNTINLNPFAIYKFVGHLDVYPPSDNWFAYTYLPDQVTRVVDNYTTMNTLLKASGALGTQWNAWQTTWSGVTSSQYMGLYFIDPSSNGSKVTLDNAATTYWGKFVAQDYAGTALNPNSPNTVNLTGSQASQLWNSYYANGKNNGWIHGSYNLYNQTVTSDQTRSGVQTTLVPQTTDTVSSTNVISQTAIPYIRQRTLVFKTTGLKPQTAFYTFFDSVNISSYVSQAQVMEILPIAGQSSQFDSTTDFGSAITSVVARQLPGDSVSYLSVGDVVAGQTSGTTAVVVGQEIDPTTGKNYLYVVNTQASTVTSAILQGGTTTSTSGFVSGEVLVGQNSGATVTNMTSTQTFVSPLFSNPGSNPIYSTVNGNVYGLLIIPNNNTMAFRTGTANIMLSDGTSANSVTADSFALTTYAATGIAETVQNNMTTTISGQIVQNQVSQNQTVTTSQLSANFLSYGDPVSQSFLVTNTNGIFVTGFDAYFASVDTSVPVMAQIVNMVNGYPGQVVVPYSTVTLSPNQIQTSTNGSVATRFTFPSPVYLNGNTEYAIQLISNSNNYNVFIATMGSRDLITNAFVATQPYAGVLFESKNSSTWVADNNSVLKFVLYQAQFNTTASTFNMIAANVPWIPLPINPFYSVTGSNQVVVNYISHGLSNGSVVSISGGASGNGIPLIQGNYTVSGCTLDTFTITAAANATFTGMFGGTGVVAQGNIQYDTLMLDAQEINYSATSTMYQLKPTTGKSVNGSETPYLTSASFYPITNKTNVPMPATSVIASPANSAAFLSNAPSLYIQCTLQSTDSSQSPVIDMSRCSVTTIQNKVNYPSVNNETVASNSSTYSKYVTVPIKLQNPADNLHIMFGYNLNPGNNILVYYKTSLSSNGGNISNETYTLLNPDTALTSNTSGGYNDASYTAMGISSYDTLILKIVMQSKDEANVPLLQSLRIISTS